VWQSHAPAGTLKLTGVRGSGALARTVLNGRASAAAPAAPMAPAKISRREYIALLKKDSHTKQVAG
jgi:hypothetical protein